MPNGHIEQYLDAIRRIQRERIRITKDQQKQIAALYREIAADLEQRLKKYNPNTLGYRWLDDYAKVLRSAATDLTNGIVDIVTGNMLAIANSVVQAEMTLWSAIAPGLSERFSDVFSSIPQSVVNELLSGDIYKDFRGLSERLWNYQGKFDRDIQYIINQGILAQKSAYDLAKDLERYLNPSARKPFDWSKVYPGVYKTVDYNAQRLARTSITHAYQLAFQRATKDNPFVEKYKWLASNGGRVCPLCASRDGQLFDKDAVPLDHPNGMCTLVAVIPKSYDQIAEELADWTNGGDNPALDKWLYPSGKSGIIKLERNIQRRDKNIGAFSNLGVAMQKKCVHEIARKYAVDLTGITIKIQRSEALLSLPICGCTDYDNIGRIDLFPNAFLDEETLVRTLIHEKYHVQQIKKYGKKYAQDNLAHMEKQAYRLENILYLILSKKVK